MKVKTKTPKASPADYRPRVAGIEFGATSATVTGEVTKAKLLATVGSVQLTNESTAWWLGGLLAYATPEDGGKGIAKYEEILPYTTYKTAGSLRNIASISRKVPPESRVEGVHWRTHKVVAPLKTKADKKKYLRMANREDMTSDELALQINRDAMEANAPGSAGKAAEVAEAMACTCPTCHQPIPADLPDRLRDAGQDSEAKL
jgi:hypothetical protein